MPRIVRTQFEPKEGRVPFDVTFNVVAEDADTIVCSETLTYHFDFDGDGNEDATSKKGRYVNRYTKAGKYDVKIWVTDSANSLSKPVNKFVIAEDNKGPAVVSLLADPSSSVAGSFVTMLSWQAYDPDGGTLAAIKVDFGDGSPILQLTGDQTTAYHMFTKAGQFVITVTAVDVDGAEASRSTAVVVVIGSRPSSLVQTIGSSQAIALDDNEGQYWNDANGQFLYGYVADGPVALKTVKYPLSAFAASNPQGEAELIGWADPGHALDERWDDVVSYKNLVVVSGSQGMQIFNVHAEPSSRTCTAADYAESRARYAAGVYRVSQHCYPGTPTKPVVICAPGGGYTSGMTIRELQLLQLEDGSQTWAVGNTPTGGSSNGGLQLMRLDTLLTDDYYVDPARCPGGWQHTALNGSSFTGNNNVLGSNTHGMAVDRDHAYIGMSQGGLYVVPVGDYARNRPVELAPTFKLNELPEYSGLQTVGYGVAIAKARPVSETMYDFPDIGERQAMYGSIGNGDCDERKVVVSASKAATEAVIHIDGPLILPGNRVAIETSGYTDYNGGAGYLVTRNEAANGNVVIGYAAEPTSLTADWVAVYPIPVSFGVLPAYPGRNPVVFSSSQAGSLAMNGVCRNFINAYEPIVEPVGVQYQSAPLGFVALDTLEDGILVFDQSNAASPEILAFVTGRAPAESMVAHGNYLYMSGGYLGKVDIVDISDPDHMDLNFGLGVRAFRVGTHCNLTCSFTERDFSINRMEFVTTPTNADGVLLIAGGNVGMNALSVAGAIEAGNVKTSCPADAPSATNACFTKVAGLQLRHEGSINDIQMIGNQYALVSQERGGVLVFDTSAIPYLGSVTFVAHVRTEDNPRAMRVVTDAAGAPQSLWIADATSFYKIAFTDPTKPGASIRVTSAGKSEFNCVEYTSGKIFVCFSEPDPANPGLTRQMVWFANGDTIPTTTIRLGESSTLEYCTPKPTVISAGFMGLSTAWLAGRFMMFVETLGYGNVLRELKTDGNENIIVSANAATGCHWNAGSITGVHSSYQERKGPTPWKRLYTASSGGVIEALDVDGFEAELALGGFDTNIGPASLGERDLSTAVGGYVVYVQRLVALGPYLFVAADEQGAFIVDASVAENMQIIGQTSISVARPIVASTLNAMAYTTGDPNDPATRYTYTVLISDNTLGGGIQLIEFPGLERP